MEPHGWLLGIDTSTELAGIVLYDGTDTHQTTWRAGREQSTQVLARVQHQIEVLGIELQDLSAVTVATGPGSFTGLRVGLSLAKGIALGCGIPIIGIPTLSATALPWVLAGVSVIAVLPAGRNRVVWQRFRLDELESDEAAEPMNTNVGELIGVADSAGIQTIVGELPPALHAMMSESSVPIVVDAGLASRIGAIGALGWNRHVAGDADELATLTSIYVHGIQAPMI